MSQVSQARSTAGSVFKVGDASDGASVSFSTLVDISKIAGFKKSLSTIETTHLDSPNNAWEGVGGKLDYPEISITGSLVLEDTNGQMKLFDAMETRTKLDFQIAFNTPLHHKASFTALVTQFDTDVSVGGKYELSMALKPTGPVSITHD